MKLNVLPRYAMVSIIVCIKFAIIMIPLYGIVIMYALMIATVAVAEAGGKWDSEQLVSSRLALDMMGYVSGLVRWSGIESLNQQ